MNNNSKNLLNSAIILTFATIFLYCVSVARYHGYIKALALDSNVLDRNFYFILYDGFIHSFPHVITAIFILTIAYSFYAYFIKSEIVTYLRSGYSNKKKYVRLRRFFSGRYKPSLGEMKARKKARVLMKVIGIILLFLLALLYYEREGSRQAELFLDGYSKGALDISRLTTVIVNGQKVELYRVACGESKCAGVNKVDNRLYYFPNDNFSHGFPFKDIPSEDKKLSKSLPAKK